ncbi:MAG: hypothetical protein EPO22_08470 [Dehalococcoidia bacterium]|nr:MAG: hypothetical protein EPO22_08470 [Dehalococcoidia bacterium]
MRRVILFMCLTCLAALSAAASACGGSNSSTATQSPLRGSSSAGTPSGAAPSAVTETPGAGGGAPNGTSAATTQPVIKISASNIKYDKDTLMAQPGAIKIEFDNNDANVTHNFAVYKSSSDTSMPLGATPITSGPDKQTLTITLDQGEYYYQCEVHPTEMNGKLIVH